MHTGLRGIIAQIFQFAGRLVVTMAQHGFHSESCQRFKFIINGGIAHIRHLVYCRCFYRQEDIVFICEQEFIHRRHYVITVRSRKIMFREFPDNIIAFIERISHRTAIFPAFVFQTVSSVSVQEPVFMEMSCCHAA